MTHELVAHGAIQLQGRLASALASSAESTDRLRLTVNRTRVLREQLHASRGRRGALLTRSRVAAVERRRHSAGLTPRQHEVLVLVSRGLSTKAIARELWLSPATVRNH